MRAYAVKRYLTTLFSGDRLPLCRNPKRRVGQPAHGIFVRCRVTLCGRQKLPLPLRINLSRDCLLPSWLSIGKSWSGRGFCRREKGKTGNIALTFLLMDWLFVLLGLLLGAIATFLVYYGQYLIRHPHESNSPSQVSNPSVRQIILTQPQEKLLRLIWELQEKHATHKLVISRQGMVIRPRITCSPTESLLVGLYDTKDGDLSRAKEFEVLMGQMPDTYSA